MTPKSVQAMIDQALQRNSTNGDRATVNMRITEGTWIEKMEAVFNISGCAIENQVKFATCTCYVLSFDLVVKCSDKNLGPEANAMTWKGSRKKMTDKSRGRCVTLHWVSKWLTLICTKFVANETEKVDKYISGIPNNIYKNVKSARPKTLDETIELANDLMDQKLRTYAERQNVVKVYNMGTGEKNPYGGSLPKSTGNINIANTQKGNGAAPKGNGCFECGALEHFKRDCPKLKNKDGGNGNAQGWVYAVGNAEKRGNASGNPDSNVVTGTFLLNNHYASILFDTGADRSFISTAFSFLIDIVPTSLDNSYDVELVDGKIVRIDIIIRGCTLNFLDHPFHIDLMAVELGSFDVIIVATRENLDSQLSHIQKLNSTWKKDTRSFWRRYPPRKRRTSRKENKLRTYQSSETFLKCFPRTLPGFPLARSSGI
ncbi:putative reverse transcriptase domain-containing protein [Tanacetum coccineum]|uniref:Reverse transcriptase domain-containing protein n=1 Tax=Tanacetum coccineum TaxID=301880 RepID=A0ABQ4WQN5_9ASTR